MGQEQTNIEEIEEEELRKGEKFRQQGLKLTKLNVVLRKTLKKAEKIDGIVKRAMNLEVNAAKEEERLKMNDAFSKYCHEGLVRNENETIKFELVMDGTKVAMKCEDTRLGTSTTTVALKEFCS